MELQNRKHGARMSDDDAIDLALKAVMWIVSDDERAGRLLELTGLSPDDLRAGLSNKAMLSDMLGYLTNYEPDLIAFAEHGNVPPETIALAYFALGGQHWEG